MAAIDAARVRRGLLEVVTEYNRIGPGYFQSKPVLNETARRLGIQGRTDAEQVLLTLFGDLFLQGLLAWGHDVSNPDPPFLHLTERGRDSLKHFSRDPANPSGYLAELSRRAAINPVAMSYLEEALRTFNAACWKATAVMVGAAAESLALEVRDVIKTRLTKLKRTGTKDLDDWRIKRVLDAIQKELGPHKGTMGGELGTSFEAYWPAFTQAIRTVRNEAGHPVSVAPVTPEAVHGTLLILPELAALAQRLREWIAKEMK